MSENIFITDDFLLHSEAARTLYHDFAKKQPIFDYHCHLSPKDIAEDRQFENLYQIWIVGDHYKYRAMRANGVNEKFITGDASDYVKFLKWAETVPNTLRNPLYHWTHLELKNYFGITTLLNPDSAESIYNQCSELLKKREYSVRNILRKMNVKVVGTTDDPTDDLAYHKQLQEENFEIKVLPSFRPDKATEIEKGQAFVDWIQKLEIVVGFPIINFETLIKALKERHTYFHEVGCRISDHGHTTFYGKDYTLTQVNVIFRKGLKGEKVSSFEMNKYKSAVLHELALMNKEKSWTQQFHVGAIRNNNVKMLHSIGPDQGYDSIGDLNMADSMSKFFGKLSECDGLANTIVYNLNPRDSEMFASMANNFNDGLVAGKMQYGAAWWFLDQKDGMEKQLNILSNFGLLSKFVGMVTDSRSFLSFPRHEYFRRILCNVLGEEIQKGELPDDMNLIGNMVEGICYKNAKSYFKINI
ncbi:glucuronate isomerase [Flavobacterium franklandianum]|uniref:glucuronate isomerase n=1 Tax=Flavobacterium franklandianum TaxID=2594430 RepID=UPI00117BC536|nr:glucuronate isomerase [Flavobacterium franklandianum]TRX22598.1 glucuronate isomerase [Flavobacterium franklandianum]